MTAAAGPGLARRWPPPRGLAAAWLLLALAQAPVLAKELPLWELGLGAAWVHLPHYRGSDQSHDWILPVPYAVYRGQFLRATREGARAVLLDSERYDFDISVSASAPTRSDDNRARAGMPDLPATLEVGPNLNSTLARGAGWKLDLRMPVHAVATVQKRTRFIGWTVSPVLNLDLEVAGWNLGLQGGPRWASRRYHGYYYGVDPEFATATRAAYIAPGGDAGWRATAGVSRRFGALWLGAFVRSDSVAGASFENSPLVRQRHDLAYGLAMSWVFKVSDERVSRDD